MANLYIIGNGFDIMHSLETRYYDFKNYLMTYHKSEYDILNNYFGNNYGTDENMLWSAFEAGLAMLNVDKINDDNNIWDVDMLVGKMKIINDLFLEYFKIIDKKLTKSEIKHILIFKDDDLFFSFNYTNLLEEKYNVKKQNVMHIHNHIDEEMEILDAMCNENNYRLIVGHQKMDSYSNDEFGRFLKESEKPIDLIIKTNENYFDSLPKKIDKVIFIGFSYNEIDLPYIEKLKSKTNKDTNWIFTYYSDNDYSNSKNYILKLNLCNTMCNLININDFIKKQAKLLSC